uniref:Uncharacterized protein n=1 Tax=Anopheles coluzzii TaxID=1518534 RepID=A0A8W7PBK9_ANOCL
MHKLWFTFTVFLVLATIGSYAVDAKKKLLNNKYGDGDFEFIDEPRVVRYASLNRAEVPGVCTDIFPGKGKKGTESLLAHNMLLGTGGQTVGNGAMDVEAMANH